MACDCAAMMNILIPQSAASNQSNVVYFGSESRHGLLCANGFKPRIATFDGFEVPVPLSISIQHGDGDILQVVRDILGLTKLKSNSCQLGEGRLIHRRVL